MKLEIKHLAAYLPYGLTGVYDKTPFDGKYTRGTMKLNCDEFQFFLGNSKPLLHPLSKLTEEIEHDGDTFVPLKRLND